MRRIGLIIYREEVKNEFKEVFNELFNKYCDKKLINNLEIIGHENKVKGWVTFQISYNSFKNYLIFDNFLLEFVNKTRLNKNIIVIGHNDEDGFMWMDYQTDYINLFGEKS